jgi:hypothetical protein
MRQHAAVIQTLEKLGGQATLGELYYEVMKVKDATWKTRTPFASIRRIVQTRQEIFKVRPGLWALRSYKDRLGLTEQTEGGPAPEQAIEQSHSYYQGLLVIIGNLRGLSTFVPNQDKNRRCVTKKLAELRTLHSIPHFSYDPIVQISASVDVSWFNGRLMPISLFEVEHSTDIHNSLLKFLDLQDFYTRMVIVADENRRREYERKTRQRAFDQIAERVNFLPYDSLVKQYEIEVLRAKQTFAL